MLDGDDAAEWVEDDASELVRWVDCREARAPGDRGQRNRAHEDSCRRHQGAQSVERDTGHDTDDRLLRAEGQIRECGWRVLRSHAHEHDVRPGEDGLVAVGDVDGWVASG